MVVSGYSCRRESGRRSSKRNQSQSTPPAVLTTLSAGFHSANLKEAERGRTQIPRRNVCNSVHWRGGGPRKPDRPQGFGLHEARQSICRRSSYTQAHCRSCSSDPRDTDPHCRSECSGQLDSAHSLGTLYIAQPALLPNHRPPTPSGGAVH